MNKLSSLLCISLGLLVSSTYSMEKEHISSYTTIRPTHAERIQGLHPDTLQKINGITQSLQDALHNDSPLPNFLFCDPHSPLIRDTMEAVAQQLAENCGMDYCFYQLEDIPFAVTADHIRSLFAPTQSWLEQTVNYLGSFIEAPQSARKKMIVIEDFSTSITPFGERVRLCEREAKIQTVLLALTQAPSQDYMVIFITGLKPQGISEPLYRRAYPILSFDK